MAARPLPEASYHTADFTFHSSPDVDPEAVDSYGPSEKEPPITLRTSQDTAHPRRRRPVILIILLLCCLAFVASAFTGSASLNRFFKYLACVPESHTPLVDHIPVAVRPEPTTGRVYVIQESAVDILNQKYNSTSRVGCHAANVRDYLWQAYSIVESSLPLTSVSRTAVVLHWQGADRKLRPIAILNSDKLIGPEEDLSPPSDQWDSQFGEEIDEHIEEWANVKMGVRMLRTMVRTLDQDQASRTFVLSVSFSGGANSQKVTEYLNSTYDEHGLDMSFKLPRPEFRGTILDIQLDGDKLQPLMLRHFFTPKA